MELGKNQKRKIISGLSNSQKDRLLSGFGGNRRQALDSIDNMQTREFINLLKQAKIEKQVQALESQLAKEAVLEGQEAESGPEMSLEKAQKVVAEADKKVQRTDNEHERKDEAKKLVQKAKDSINRASIALEQESEEEAEKYAQQATSEAEQAKKLVSKKQGKEEDKKNADGSDKKKDEKKEALEDADAGNGSGTVSKAELAKKVASSDGSPKEKAEAVGKEAAAEAAGEALGDAAGAAAAETGPLALAVRKAVKWATEKIIKKVLSRPLWKNLLAAFAPQLLTIVFVVVGLSLTSKAFAGNWGIGKSNQSLSASSYGTSFQVDNIILGNVPFRDWYFHQNDKNEYWHNQSYPGMTSSNRNATVGSGGCGCTSAAMVLKRYGVDTDPGKTCQWSLDNGYRDPTSGTKPGLFKAIADATPGLNYKKITSHKTALRLLANGMPLILSVSGGKNAPFTSGSGHYIVLAGREGNTIYVNNSIRRKNTTTNIAEVRRWFKHGYYLIYPDDLSQFVNE